MKTHTLLEPTLYDGLQLHPQWIEEKTNSNADNIFLSFIGPANVPIEHMVDLEDVANNAPIYSENMLHVLIKHEDLDLELAVMRQRMLVVLAHEILQVFPQAKEIRRVGDDLYEEEKKLSVSIAAPSESACCIHFALNISSKNTPVPTKGLADFGIEAFDFAHKLQESYEHELKSCIHATQKVRRV